MGYILGGIGLFLLGMSMLTDGMKQLAGDVLKKWLSKFTGGTISAVFSGAFITALIQSSSATTIITIGFVSAGLLSFTQSMGIILGANIGSTSTGWIVSLIGFKVNLQAFSLPIIGAGIFLKTFAAEKYKNYGVIAAGFGLLFLGIETLQNGFIHFDEKLVLDSFIGDTFYHKFLLIFIGFIMTVIMQSSSAAVATTLTVLHTGTISFDQAAFLVIGQNIGTTATALLASIGATMPAKRTALTHVFFNIGTGILATVISPILLGATINISTYLNGQFDAAFGIAVFHTLFNILGAILFVPFIQFFANSLIRIVPEKGNPLTRNLDTNVASVPSVAIEATYKTLIEIIKQLIKATIQLGESKAITVQYQRQITEVEDAIKTTQAFLNSVHSSSSADNEKHFIILHALDHVDRLVKVLQEDKVVESIHLQEKIMNEWLIVLQQIQQQIHDGQVTEAAAQLEITSTKIANYRRERRNEYFIRSVNSEAELETIQSKVQALLWIDRLVFHYWRAVARIGEYK